VRFIFQYPETTGTAGNMLDAGPVAQLAATAESAGWHGFAFTEHPAPGARWLDAGGHQSVDPFVALGCVAGATRTLRLLTNLAVAPYRNPIALAKAAATVDVCSGGRMVLGLGTGYLKSEFHALGVDFDERNARFDETLDVLPLAWSGEPFSYRGRHFDARDTIGRPRPVQDPIPVWIGGNSTLTLRRVAQRAQGWMPLMSHVDLSATTRTPRIASVDDLAARLQLLHTESSGRTTPIDVAASYTDPTIRDLDRDVERHRDAIDTLAAAGVTWLIVSGPSGAAASTAAFVEGFAQRYIRH